MSSDIEVQGTLSPQVTNLPTHKSEYGRGGYKSVAYEASMNGIPDLYKEDGCLVYVLDPEVNTIFQWDSSANSSIGAWIPFLLTGNNIALLTISGEHVATNEINTRHIAPHSIGPEELTDSIFTDYMPTSAIEEEYYDKEYISAAYMPKLEPHNPPTSGYQGTFGQFAISADDIGGEYLYLCLAVDGTEWGRIPIERNW